jgi:hypothetical protein
MVMRKQRSGRGGHASGDTPMHEMTDVRFKCTAGSLWAQQWRPDRDDLD